MKQKSSMNDGVNKNGATVRNVKRCQPVKNSCAVSIRFPKQLSSRTPLDSRHSIKFDLEFRPNENTT